MNGTVYIKMDRSAEVTTETVTLSDIAKLECSEKSVVNKLKTIKLLNIQTTSKQRYIVSIMKVIELINNEYPNIQVSSVGETDCVVEYSNGKSQNTFFETVKVVFVCLIIFFGASFAIMSFNNDVSVGTMFKQIYEQVAGVEEKGFSIVELAYAIGLGVGIIIFYNHFGPKKLSKDPTPIEVEMRLYENEINTTLIDGHNRQDGNLDVK